MVGLESLGFAADGGAFPAYAATSGLGAGVDGGPSRPAARILEQKAAREASRSAGSPAAPPARGRSAPAAPVRRRIRPSPVSAGPRGRPEPGRDLRPSIRRRESARIRPAVDRDAPPPRRVVSVGALLFPRGPGQHPRPSGPPSGKGLVIVESPAKAKTIERFLGEEFVVQASIGHVRDLPQASADMPAEVKGTPAAASAWTSRRASSRSTSSPPRRRSRSGPSSASSRTHRPSGSPPTRTARERRSPGTSWRCSSPRCPSTAWCSTRSRRRRSPRPGEPARDRQEPRPGAGDAPHPGPPLRLRGLAGPVAQDPPRLSARARAERRPASARRARGGADRVSQRHLLGPRAVFAAGESGPTRSTPSWSRWAGSASPRAATSTRRRASSKAKGVAVLDERAARGSRRDRRRDRTSCRSRRSPTRSARRRRSRRARCSRRPAASCGSPRAARCASPRRSTRTASSRTCVPTRRRSPRRRSRARARSSGTTTAPSSCRAKPRHYKTKVKNAQEAHEAIRPAGAAFQPIDGVRREHGQEAAALYELIWMRTVASQMPDARGRRIAVRVGVEDAVFRAAGKTIEFPGFQRAYVEGSDDPDAELPSGETPPASPAGGPARWRRRALEAEEHATQPPARYTEASLVKELDERGIGRPARGRASSASCWTASYAFRKGSALVPTFTGFAVVRMLKRALRRPCSTTTSPPAWRTTSTRCRAARATARRTCAASTSATARRACGTSSRPGMDEVDPREACGIALGEADGRRIEVRVGRYGLFLTDGEANASLPEETVPDELTLAQAAASCSRRPPRARGRSATTRDGQAGLREDRAASVPTCSSATPRRAARRSRRW